MKQKKLLKKLRRIVLAIILIFITYEAYMHQVLGGGSDGSPSIHALCPYGALESLYTLFSSGTFIQKIFSGTVVLFIISVILALIFRRSFCGLICPFGALQEFFALLGKKLFGKQLIIPKSIDKPLRLLKYGVLLLTAGAAWYTAGLWMSPYDPWAAYAHLLEGISAVIEEFPLGFALLIITIIGSILYDRFFCKYLCPMGAFLAIVSKISPNKIKRNEDTCINCDICTEACPMNIEVAQLKEINSSECINCQLCTLSCPKNGALEIKFSKKLLTPLTFIVLSLTLYFGGILLANTAGLYNVLPQPVAEGETISTEELKGYMTLEDVAKYTGTSLEELYEILNLPGNIPPATKMKEVKNYVPDFEVSTARELLQQAGKK